jgi:hypothetical protein
MRSNSNVNSTSSSNARVSAAVPTSAAEAAWMSGDESAIEEFIDGFMPGKKKKRKEKKEKKRKRFFF